MDEFAWQKQQAILYNNAFFAGLAVIAIATFIGIKFITKRYVLVNVVTAVHPISIILWYSESPQKTP